MKVFPDFEAEVKAIDPRLSIIPNPNREELANIKLDGMDICPIPRHEIMDEPDVNYSMVASNGWKMQHKSKKEALAQIHETLEMIKTPEGNSIFFDKD